MDWHPPFDELVVNHRDFDMFRSRLLLSGSYTPPLRQPFLTRGRRVESLECDAGIGRVKTPVDHRFGMIACRLPGSDCLT